MSEGLKMFKILEKNNVIEILETLNKHGKTEFSEISEKFEVSKSYMSRLLLEMEEEKLLFRTEEKKGKKIPIPSYELTEIGIRSLRIYNKEKIFRQLLHNIDEILSKKYEKIETYASVEIDQNRVGDFAYEYLRLREKIDDAFSMLINEPHNAEEELKNALTFRLIPSLTYRYGGKEDILYLFFEDHELYEHGDSIYKQVNGTVARIREIYDKTYLFLDKENIKKSFIEMDIETQEEFSEEYYQASLDITSENNNELEEKTGLRKKELFKKYYEQKVVKTPEEIAERIINHIESLKK
jgi:DNA-binding MarR family transcriptional regulator